MARRIVKVSGQYRGERFETTLTHRRHVGAVSFRLIQRSLNRAFGNLASAMGRTNDQMAQAARRLQAMQAGFANEIRVFTEYARLPEEKP